MNRFHALAHLVHQTLVRATHRRHDAELGRARRRRLARGLHERRDVQPDGPHRRLEAPRLRAEVAVLGASAGLDRDDPLDLHLRSAPAHPDLVGELERVIHPLVGELEDLQRLRLVEAYAPLEDLLTGDVEDHAGISMVVNSPSGMRPSTGAIFSRSSRLHRAARSGSAGQEPITIPRQRSPRRRIASTVSAVWLSVPRPARASTSSGASSRCATSAIVPPSASRGTSSPPAPSTITRSCGSVWMKSAISLTLTVSMPARAAARAGASGSG